ncbi:MAG: 3-oxoacyl-[acyl-carrier-protein] reductase [Bacteroidetes bacterium]|jgi:3-oxoacyl-[acyl-carrier protein] reductase|nr:3-oxoacyl-[acyl-carrier-protein] reductase [Bacteroidota bacterium]
MNQLQSKKAFVTGGTRGIGKGIVLALAEAGADVAFTYRSSASEANTIKEAIEALGRKALAIQCDAASMHDTQTAVDSAIEFLGGLDIVVNNAGITRDNLLMRMSEEQFNEVIQNNLNSVFNVTKAVMRQLLKQKSGSIINISSVVGISGNPGQANYAASKAGMNAFTKSVAKELGSRNIRCNSIAPGFIATEMTDVLDQEQVAKWMESVPLRRSGSPQDVANLVVFLGSDASAYITGQVINVCGGMQM